MIYMLSYYKAGPQGLAHICNMFIKCSSREVFLKLDLITMSSDLPIHCPSALATKIVADEATLLHEWMDFQLATGAALLRRTLWSQEGLPGMLPQLVKNDPDKVSAQLIKLKELDRLHSVAQGKVYLPHVKTQVAESEIREADSLC